MYSSFAERFQAFSVYRRIRVRESYNYFGYPGLDQRGGTRWRPAMMGAGLQRDVGSRAVSLFTGSGNSVYFRVRFAGCFMPSFPDDLTAANEHAANHRIRLSRIQPARCKTQCMRHVCAVTWREIGHGYFFFLPSNSGNSDICSREAAVSEIRCNRLISSSNSVMSWNRL